MLDGEEDIIGGWLVREFGLGGDFDIDHLACFRPDSIASLSTDEVSARAFNFINKHVLLLGLNEFPEFNSESSSRLGGWRHPDVLYPNINRDVSILRVLGVQEVCKCKF